MYEYGEACPISKATSILGERWSLQIIREMMLGAKRFSEFQRYLPRISPSLLNTRLKSLEESGVIIRKRIPEQKGYEYLLSPAGNALKPMMRELGKWGMRWAFEHLNDDEMSAVTIIRDIAVTMKLEELPSGDSNFQFLMPDLTENCRWYILLKEGVPSICNENPGFEVDVYIEASLRTLTEIWYGRISILEAAEAERFKITGPTVYTRNLTRWFPVSSLIPTD